MIPTEIITAIITIVIVVLAIALAWVALVAMGAAVVRRAWPQPEREVNSGDQGGLPVTANRRDQRKAPETGSGLLVREKRL